VGLGNPLSGDDGFGSRVLEMLQRTRTTLPPNTTLADAHTDLLNHIEAFSEYDCVVLIDAVLDPEGKLGPPGRIVVMGEAAFQSWPETSQSVHQVSPLLAVNLFRRLHSSAQTQITLVGLVVDQIAPAPRHASAERMQEAADSIRALLS
jgi:hydrogenase maturation protease